MTALTYRLPAELQQKLNDSRADPVQPPAGAFLHDDRLNMGPAILLATALSLGCWAIILGVGIRLVQ